MIGLARRVREGELSASDVVGHALEQIEAHNPTINAFVAVDAEGARSAATVVDDRIASGVDPGPFAGIPIGVKDLEDAAGYITTRGSKAFAAGGPESANSALVARLVAAGCVVVGKTNTPELGWKADTDNVVFGPTVNPWNLEHTAGGSSGGSAAAIAAGMVPLATGSDGGGSIRIPSSCCGLSGMKPSLGRVPSGGETPPDWHHLSTKGPMARRLSDVVAALDVVVGPDPSDLRSLPRPEAPWLAVLEDPRPPRRVAWSPTLGYAEIDDEVRAICARAVEVMASLGTEIVEVDTVFERDPIDDWLVLTGAYNLRTHGAIRGTPAWEEVDPILRMVIDGAAKTSAVDMVKAEDACHLLNVRLVELFRERPSSDDAHRGRGTAAAEPRRIGADQREGGLQLGQAHLSVQHDALAGRDRLCRHHLARLAGRHPVGRSSARRSGRAPFCGRPGASTRLRQAGAVPRLSGCVSLPPCGLTTGSQGYHVPLVPAEVVGSDTRFGRLAQLVRAQPSHG